MRIHNLSLDCLMTRFLMVGLMVISFPQAHADMDGHCVAYCDEPAPATGSYSENTYGSNPDSGFRESLPPSVPVPPLPPATYIPVGGAYFPQAVSRYQRAIEDGKKALQEELWMMAGASFQEALRERPGDPEAERLLKWARFNLNRTLAEQSEEDGDLDSARYSYEEILRDFPDDFEAMTKLRRLKVLEERKKRASRFKEIPPPRAPEKPELVPKEKRPFLPDGLQEDIDRLREKARIWKSHLEDWISGQAVERVLERIPGAGRMKEIAANFKETYLGIYGLIERIYSYGMRGAERGVKDLARPEGDSGTAEEYWQGLGERSRETREQSEELIKGAVDKGARGERAGPNELPVSQDRSQGVPIEKRENPYTLWTDEDRYHYHKMDWPKD